MSTRPKFVSVTIMLPLKLFEQMSAMAESHEEIVEEMCVSAIEGALEYLAPSKGDE